MIVGSAITKTGRTLLLLGVERENLNRLIGGRPIFVNPESHGIPATPALASSAFNSSGPSPKKIRVFGTGEMKASLTSHKR